MKVLMISTDRKILEEGSSVNLRMQKYADTLGYLDIIVFNKGGDMERIDFSGNMHVYPTNSKTKFKYIDNAGRIVRDLSKEEKYDVVTTQDPFETGVVGTYAKNILDCRLNVQIHTDFKSPYFGNTVKNIIRQQIAKSVLRKADSIRVVSERIKESILEVYREKTTVLPIFVDDSLMSSEKTGSVKLPEKYLGFKKKLVTVSRLEKEKDIKTLIKAVGVLGEDVGLAIIGDGSQSGYLKRLVVKLGLENRILFAGNQDQKIVAEYLNTADVYVQASLYEGFGLSIYEAGLMNTPIITTDVGLIGSVIQNGSAVVVDHRSPTDFAERVGRVLGGGNLGEQLARHAHQDVLSSQISEEEYLKRYKESLL